MRKLIAMLVLPLAIIGCTSQNTRVDASGDNQAQMAADEEQATQKNEVRNEEKVAHPAEYPTLTG